MPCCSETSCANELFSPRGGSVQCPGGSDRAVVYAQGAASARCGVQYRALAPCPWRRARERAMATAQAEPAPGAADPCGPAPDPGAHAPVCAEGRCVTTECCPGA